MDGYIDIVDIRKATQGETLMASILIRNLDDRVKARLRVRAAEHGRSMEEEARDILGAALNGEAPAQRSIVDAIRAIVEPLGGIDLPPIPREPLLREPPPFADWPDSDDHPGDEQPESGRTGR